MARRLCTKELDAIAEHFFLEPEEENEDFCLCQSVFSGGEIEWQTEDSATEQENSSEESEEEELATEQFFIGKNESTKLDKLKYRISSTIKKINVFKVRTGVT